MKKILLTIMSIVTIVAFSSCYRVTPDAGKESVLTEKPMFFGHGGVDDTPITTGSEWVVWTTDHTEFPITPVLYTEDFEKMIPADNTPVSFSVYVRLQNISGKTPVLLKNFQSEWYKNNIQAPIRTKVRDLASAYKMLELSAKREVSLKLQDELTDWLTKYVAKLNIPVTVVDVSIGAITPPDEVLAETKLTAAQNQSILTQKSRKNAEDARKEAEEAKATADVAYRNKFGMTTAEYLQLRHLEITKEQVELVKDHPNTSVTFIEGVNASPVVNSNK
jgi:regulator of protease activity HflC (stomatin/prohibitin superfamily)